MTYKNVTNLSNVYAQADLPKTEYKITDFYKNQIVQCDLFKYFMVVMDIDEDLNRVYIYNIDENSDTYALKPYQLKVPENFNQKTAELLYK